MKQSLLICGLVLFTTTLVLSVLYQNQRIFFLSIVFQVLSVLVTRDALKSRRWYQPLWLTWSGASLLGAGWLEASEGLNVTSAFISFGPGYLIMAVMAMVWPGWFNKAR